MPKTFTVTGEFEVTIIVQDDAPDDLFTRAEDKEGFQDYLYGDAVKDQETVLKHWAYNAVANGVSDPVRLDGWADIERDKVFMDVSGVWGSEVLER